VEKGGSAGAGQQEAGGDGARGGDGKGSSETGQRLKKYQIGGGQWRGGSRRRGRGLRSSRGEPQEEREDGVELKQGELVGKSCEWIGTTTEASRTIHFVVVSSSGADENGGRKEVDDKATPRQRQPLPTAATSARWGLGFGGRRGEQTLHVEEEDRGVASGRTGGGGARSRDAGNAREMVKAPEGSWGAEERNGDNFNGSLVKPLEKRGSEGPLITDLTDNFDAGIKGRD
jgi:hypothetical protein